MIKKINVKKFGLFNNYLWDSSIGRDFKFKKLNIIYGRNYSGKTTLSRMFRCFELAEKHIHYLDCDYSLTLNDGTIISSSNIDKFTGKIRVYNSDFVKNNLSWLHKEDGTIIPFTILGAKNVEIDNKIKEIEEKLGSVEDNKGLLFKQSTSIDEFNKRSAECKQKVSELDSKLTNKAREIKNNARIYNLPTYQINSIKADISKTNNFSAFLNVDEMEEKLKLIKEEPNPDIKKLIEQKPNFETFLNRTNDLLVKKIAPTKSLNELIQNSLLQEWVRQGIEKHRGVRTTCGFCGSALPSDLWEKLDAHFSKESELLRKEIEAQIEVIEKAKRAISEFINIKVDAFYLKYQKTFQTLEDKWNEEVKEYQLNLDKLINALKERQEDIFHERGIVSINDISDILFNIIKQLNELINENNETTNSLGVDQNNARNELRLSEISKFIKDIDYNKRNDENTALNVEVGDLEKIVKELFAEINGLMEEKRKLESQAKDESKGAELVNSHLSHFFGHDELKLVAEGETPNMKFKITRDNNEAKNLSEGETSLISFCYFIAKMEDELKDSDNLNKLIIYIDDSISSLDSNHIFFMFSLIESVIAKPQKYAQLFISTHNLDFLKYLKRLTLPKVKAQPDSKPKNSMVLFFIERKGKMNTTLRIAPDYLKNYITEFNYLFGEIYNCSISNEAAINHSYSYNFGNNMRKFLEAYLFYKYPSHNLTTDQRLDKFFESEAVTINLVNRVINEYSHLGEHFDRGLEPLDVDAISKISKLVINRIKIADPQQYAALVDSLDI